MRTKQTGRRSGFTLVELLVVISIVIVLLAITIPAALRVMDKGKEVENRNDITQLANSLDGAFKQKHGFIPPSRLRICPMLRPNPGSTPYTTPGYFDDPLKYQLDQDSIDYILRMFSKCDTNWTAGTIQWGRINNGTPTVLPPAGVILEGDQCMVFFLGGVQVSASGVNGCMGFSSDSTNPMQWTAGVTTGRIGPHYEFKTDRLVAGTNGFFSFKDVYGTKMAYFSSYKARNGYNRYFLPPAAPTVPQPAQIESDCKTLGVWPYRDPLGIYQNPETFQLISAGKNKRFGPGTDLSVTYATPTPGTPSPWTPALADSVGDNGSDDLSNFHGRVLGIP